MLGTYLCHEMLVLLPRLCKFEAAVGQAIGYNADLPLRSDLFPLQLRVKGCDLQIRQAEMIVV